MRCPHPTSAFRVALVIACLSGWDHARAASITLPPSADTTLFQKFPGNNLGTSRLAAGSTADGFYSRALIQFDVASQMPSNAIVTSARLTVTVLVVPSGGGEDSDFNLHRVERAWGEGNKGGLTGAAATSGEATWFTRFHSLTFWGASGAEEGADYSSTVSASTAVSGRDSYTFESNAEMVADVQKWLDEPANSFGWIMISSLEDVDATARRFGSREDAANAPSLQIEYELPASEVRIARSEIAGDRFKLYFTAEATRSYAVEFRNLVAEGPWLTLTNISAPLATTAVVVSDSLSASPQRFYRIAEISPAP